MVTDNIIKLVNRLNDEFDLKLEPREYVANHNKCILESGGLAWEF